MPFPVGAAIAAAGAVAGSGINATIQGKMNRKSIQYAREAYQREYQDSLAFWNMQNEYNSPAAQMQRYQEAGLNPNLVYSNGGSAGNAGQIQVPDMQRADLRAPEWGNAIPSGISAFSAIYDLDIKQAQADLLRKQNTLLDQEANLKAAQTDQVRSQTDRTRYDLEFDTEHRDISSDARRESLRQLKTSIDLSLRRDAREAALNSSTIQEAAERMLNLRQQRDDVTPLEMQRTRYNIELLKKEGVLKDLEITLRKAGINPNDPMWSRMVAQFLDKFVDIDLSEVGQGIRKKYEEAKSSYIQSIPKLFQFSPIKF